MLSNVGTASKSPCEMQSRRLQQSTGEKRDRGNQDDEYDANDRQRGVPAATSRGRLLRGARSSPPGRPLEGQDRTQGWVAQSSSVFVLQLESVPKAGLERRKGMNPKPYPSDLTSQQWAILKPLLPPARTGGRPRKTEMRSVVNAIFYRNRNGCIRRALPHDFPHGGPSATTLRRGNSSTTPLNPTNLSGGFVRMISMNKTYTPELTPEVLQRLRDYAEQFRDLYRHTHAVRLERRLPPRPAPGWRTQEHRADGRPRPLPAGTARHPRTPNRPCNNSSTRAPGTNRTSWPTLSHGMAETFASPEGIFVIDDTGFPKQGKHSVGVQHQYCGQLGKKANCQVAVTVHYVSPKGHFPAALRLYLPESWTGSPERLEEAGVPEAFRQAQTKGQIALELLDQVRGEGLCPATWSSPMPATGSRRTFREGLAQRGLFYIVGVTAGDGRLHRGAAVGAARGPRLRGRPRDAAPSGRGQPATGEPEGSWPKPAAPEGDLARGDQGEAVGEVRLGAGLAGPGLGHGASAPAPTRSGC